VSCSTASSVDTTLSNTIPRGRSCFRSYSLLAGLSSIHSTRAARLGVAAKTGMAATQASMSAADEAARKARALRAPASTVHPSCRSSWTGRECPPTSSCRRSCVGSRGWKNQRAQTAEENPSINVGMFSPGEVPVRRFLRWLFELERTPRSAYPRGRLYLALPRRATGSSFRVVKVRTASP
jgi:hypothetical protein